MKGDLDSTFEKILEFREERDWKQFHDPKNLAEAISIEAGELLEQFLWLSTEESEGLTGEKLERAKEETADILIFLVYMCDKLGVDVWEVIDAAATKPFGFMKFTPGPGLGGHCIPIDPLYLSWKLRALNYTARFIDLASEINTGMPRYVVGKVQDALNELGKPLKGGRILVLGVAYKPDIDDLRESPALDVIGLLRQKGAQVVGTGQRIVGQLSKIDSVYNIAEMADLRF